MVKLSKRVNERDLEPQFQAALRALITRAPFLTLRSLKRDVQLGTGRVGRPDWLAELRAGDQSWTLVAEEGKSGQPREVRSAVLQLKDYLSQFPPDRPACGLVLAPFISEESARICTEAGIGYADLAGNARLSFDRIFIEVRSAEKPRVVKREARSIFSPKATRVLRVLLQGPLRAWKVKELAAAAEVSLGHVSAVRQKLLEREWAAEEDGGLRVTKANALLDAWVAADDWSRRTEVREYSLLEGEAAQIASRVHGFLGAGRHAFTQWFGAFLRRPYALPVVTTVYVSEFPTDEALKAKLGARRVDSGGGGLRLVVPRDEGVFNGARDLNGLPVVSDVQLYLDLQRAGLRGDEAAEELRKAPDFAGGWE